MIDLHSLHTIQCTTALEVQLLAALVHERHKHRELRLRIGKILQAREQKKPQLPEVPKPQDPPPEEPKPPVQAKMTGRACWFVAPSEHMEGSVRAGDTTVKLIQEAVARRFGVTVMELKCTRRQHNIVLPRQVAAWLCYVLTPHSYPQLGRMFGGRDHSTILNSVEKLRPQLEPLCHELTMDDAVADWVDRAFERVSGKTSPEPIPEVHESVA